MLPLFGSLLSYTALLAAVLAFVPGAGLLGALAVSLAVLLGWSNMRAVPRVVFVVAGLALVFALGRDPRLIEGAATNMTRLAGLILAVMLLSTVLAGSGDLKRISASLFSGTPRARYASVVFGTALVAVPLTFGAVAVVGSLVAERIRAQGDSGATRNGSRAQPGCSTACGTKICTGPSRARSCGASSSNSSNAARRANSTTMTGASSRASSVLTSKSWAARPHRCATG